MSSRRAWLLAWLGGPLIGIAWLALTVPRSFPEAMTVNTHFVDQMRELHRLGSR